MIGRLRATTLIPKSMLFDKKNSDKIGSVLVLMHTYLNMMIPPMKPTHTDVPKVVANARICTIFSKLARDHRELASSFPKAFLLD
jgi:hypothetical protein